jgi:hypothetical protein
MEGVTRELYHLPRLLAASMEDTVYVVEGEKDVHTLEALGVVATTNPGGATKWLPRYSDTLRGRPVVIIPDNDTPGEAHAAVVSQALEGVAASCKVLRLPGLPVKGDVSDWVASGGTREALEALLGEEEEEERVWIETDSVQEEDIPWLWWPYLIRGTLCMLDGDPGQGKSMASLAIAAHLSRGMPFPDQQGEMTLPSPVGYSLFFANEDHLGSVVVPRLKALGADLSKVAYFIGKPDKNGLVRERFTMQEMEVLEETVTKFIAAHGEPPTLIVLDPIQAYLGKGVSMNNAAETRPLLEALALFARKYDCTVVCIRHASKGGGVDGNLSAMMRGGGATDITGAARTVLFVQEHPQIKTQALFMQVKANASIKGRTLLFSRADGAFQWQGVTRIDAEDIAGSGRGMSPRERIKAAFWVERKLDGGYPLAVSDLMLQAEEYGIPEKQVYGAKDMLGVEARRVGFGKDGYFEWRLPDLTILNPPVPKHLQEINKENTVVSATEKENTEGTPTDHPSSTRDSIERISTLASMPSMERMDISMGYTYTDDSALNPILPIRPIVPLVTPALGAHANTQQNAKSQGINKHICLCGAPIVKLAAGRQCIRCNAVYP